MKPSWTRFTRLPQLFYAPSGLVGKEQDLVTSPSFSEWEADEIAPDKVTDLVSLQIFITMGIRASHLTPTTKIQRASASRHPPLSRAIDLGFTMKMYSALPTPFLAQSLIQTLMRTSPCERGGPLSCWTDGRPLDLVRCVGYRLRV